MAKDRDRKRKIRTRIRLRKTNRQTDRQTDMKEEKSRDDLSTMFKDIIFTYLSLLMTKNLQKAKIDGWEERERKKMKKKKE